MTHGLAELTVTAIFGGLLGLVLGAAIREAGARADALRDAGIALRRLSGIRYEDGDWVGSGALREGAAVVERLDEAEA